MISVIIPVYNTEAYLEACIRSILASTYQDFEIILINDGSEDASPAICRKYCQRDPRIRLIEQGHQGVSAARNRGIEISRGEWIVFVDSDDRVSERFLEMTAKQKYQTQELLIFNHEKYGSRLYRLLGGSAGKGKRQRKADEIPYGREDTWGLIEKILRAQQLECRGMANLRSPCAKAYKKSVIDRYNIRFPEDVSMGEDRLFNMEYQWRARNRLYIPETAYYVRWRADSASHGFHPDYLQRDYRLQKRQRQLLVRSGLLPQLREAYYDSVLSNMAHVLIKGIFNPKSPRRYRENCRLCQKMQKGALYREALSYAGQSGNKTGVWPRRLLLYFYRRERYGAVSFICRVCHGILLRI